MIYLTQQQIITINQNINPKSGYSLINQGALAEAVDAPQISFLGKELNCLLGQKSAALVYPIAQNHPFEDANKRTAYQALLNFLILNGYSIIPGRANFVQQLIGNCAENPPINKEVLSGRLQMQFLKNGNTFVAV